ncbi:hypothetical protein V5O48_017541, partial [Marasmius crinis-equi]
RLQRMRYPRKTRLRPIDKKQGVTAVPSLAVVSAIPFLSSQVRISGLSNVARRFRDFSFLTGNFEQLEGATMIFYIGGK